MWASDVNCVANDFDEKVAVFRLRGLQGATGTQASFMQLLHNDADQVDIMQGAFLAGLSNGFDRKDFDFLIGNASIKAGCFPLLNRISEIERKLPEADQCSWLEHSALLKILRDQYEEANINKKKILAESLRRVTRQHTFQCVGQTYPRVVDAQIISRLASIASVLHKIATDIRLLSNRKEIDEPFGKSQIGSSAMPYKRNPMKCERICGLTRFVMNLVGNAYDTAATQWLERTLDDSSNRRLSLPEAFLALDGALDLMHTVASGLIVNEAMVKRNLMAELPFMATENIMMEAVKLGRDRQDVHEAIRVLSHEAGYVVKQEGKDNDLLERLKKEPLLEGIDIDAHLDPMAYIGRSVEQTERFLKEVVEPLRERYKDELEALGSADRGV